MAEWYEVTGSNGAAWRKDVGEAWRKDGGRDFRSLWVLRAQGMYSIGTLHTQQSKPIYPTLEAAMLAAEVLYG